MNEKELRKLYDAVSNKYNIGTWEQFRSKMQTVEQRKSFYNAISNKFNIGDYNSFEMRLGGGGTSNTQTPVTADVNTGVKNVSTSFSCIVKNTFWSGRIKTTSDPNHIVYKLPGDQEYNFYADGSFIYRDIPPYRTNIKGTWVCDGSSDFVINMEDDSRFESKIGKWKENVSAQPVTDLKEKSEKRRGTYLKIGDKNPKVGELQKCLIDKGFKNISKDGHIDNKFGMRTKQSVMDFQSKNGLKVSGVVDKKTWELLGGTSTLEEQKIIRKIVHQNLKSLIK